ncbi:unnamed protein product [Camellia sinensis]
MLLSHDGSSKSEISEKTIKMKKKIKMMKIKKIIEGIVVMGALVFVEAEGFRSIKVAIDKAKKQCRFSLGSAFFYASSTLMSSYFEGRHIWSVICLVYWVWKTLILDVIFDGNRDDHTII